MSAAEAHPFLGALRCALGRRVPWGVGASVHRGRLRAWSWRRACGMGDRDEGRVTEGKRGQKGAARRRRWRRPGWLQLLTSRDFGAISLINGIMFMTANGSRSVLVPLHGHQAFGLTTTVMGAPRRPQGRT